MALDDGRSWDEVEEVPVDMAKMASRRCRRPEKIGVVVDLSHVTSEMFDAWGISPAIRYVCRNGVHGHRLSLPHFLSHRHELPPPTRIYWEGASGLWIDPVVRLSDWAYILGFWIGDGWIDSNRIGFAVENALVKRFVAELSMLPGIRTSPKISGPEDKGSKEIRVGHMIFAELLRSVFGNRPHSTTKRIPASWIISWPRSARMELLRGLVDSDGHVSVRSRGRKRIFYTTTSLDLARSLLSLLRSVGVSGSISPRRGGAGGMIGDRQIIGKDSYSVHWSAHSMAGNSKGHYGSRRHFEHAEMKFIETKVGKVETLKERPEYVYDISVDGHPSFVSDGVLVHNTATPWRLDRRGLGRMYQHMVITAQVQELVDDGFLLPVRAYAPDLPDLSKVKTKAGDYDIDAVSEIMGSDKLVGNIVDHWLRLGEGRRTVVFASSVENSKHLSERFTDAGVRAEHLDGSDDDSKRDAVLDRLAQGETTIICNCDLLVEGWDLPSLGCVVLARPTKSLTRYLQQVGRGMRPHSDQSYMILLDHAACVHEHGLPTDPRRWSLEDRPKKKKGQKTDDGAVTVQCEKCGVLRPITVEQCPACAGIQIQVFRGILHERDEDLVEVKPTYTCQKCGSSAVGLKTWGELEIQVKCRSCHETSYEVDRQAAKHASEDLRRKEYDRLIQVQRSKKFKDGWVFHRYKNLFGRWPPSAWRSGA